MAGGRITIIGIASASRRPARAYSIGFENALRRWRPLLRRSGCLVVTEVVWFVAEPARDARAFFAGEYPDMRDEATRMDQARSAGYDLLGSFRLPAGDWHAYYAGLEAPLHSAISQWGERDVYAAIRREQQIYRSCGNDYGYLCLVLQAQADSPAVARQAFVSPRRACPCTTVLDP